MKAIIAIVTDAGSIKDLSIDVRSCAADNSQCAWTIPYFNYSDPLELPTPVCGQPGYCNATYSYVVLCTAHYVKTISCNISGMLNAF